MDVGEKVAVVPAGVPIAVNATFSVKPGAGI